MMLIITHPIPVEAVDFLIKYSNNNFCWKQLLELSQLLCSCGYSDVFKPVKQGKEIQKWIKKNENWVYSFYNHLYQYCCKNIKMKLETKDKLYKIKSDFYKLIDRFNGVYMPETAIWRYNKEYASIYGTNSELPIFTCCRLYRGYLNYKFSKLYKLERMD